MMMTHQHNVTLFDSRDAQNHPCIWKLCQAPM